MKLVAMDGAVALAPAGFLGDLGAHVVRVDRAVGDNAHHAQLDVHTGDDWATPMGTFGTWHPISVDLKHPRGAEVVLRLIENADGFVEGFRPGVAERLGIGPDACLSRNPRLVYLRMTGWGQTGPLAEVAGHDFNYLAIAGAIGAFGREGEIPFPPLNLLGDMAGGLHGALGLLAGIFEARKSGKGQVIDAAIIDTVTSLMGFIYLMQSNGIWTTERGNNLMDGGAPFLNVYETADGKFVTVTPFEPQFWSEFLRKLGLDESELPPEMDRASWPELRQRIAQVFKTKTRDEWAELLEYTDACVSPVLSLAEAPDHPHNVARGTFIRQDGAIYPAQSPRFSRTRPGLRQESPSTKESRRTTLVEWGFGEAEIDRLLEGGVIV
ncbi:CoA transferase [Nocardia sp. NBC_00508]|uniref:CaiB/BaiF CoA transferase family protein n=1 Tax=Nocardia sp. NBC_00508 TaxID=2975992 RepID=UPI002E80A578|nr:CaiB/BaiF CoA-transferase family protein [Nocardia sp. NBC_00508]WUD67099.1 CoA transferase [Nocardia sp. NBC_00508]